ncbi:Protein of unknown function [Bacillus wiedmannii]|uniref:Uncharacterized protein n=1 Tax=Bacillus wiedmannii TaxID=1890302 RepID=A0A1C4GEM1_9BACI|nr:Protein of unknown function [Bacillus wiedmannii]
MDLQGTSVNFVMSLS